MKIINRTPDYSAYKFSLPNEKKPQIKNNPGSCNIMIAQDEKSQTVSSNKEAVMFGKIYIKSLTGSNVERVTKENLLTVKENIDSKNIPQSGIGLIYDSAGKPSKLIGSDNDVNISLLLEKII